jgi:hypothetical protein
MGGRRGFARCMLLGIGWKKNLALRLTDGRSHFIIFLLWWFIISTFFSFSRAPQPTYATSMFQLVHNDLPSSSIVYILENYVPA